MTVARRLQQARQLTCLLLRAAGRVAAGRPGCVCACCGRNVPGFMPYRGGWAAASKLLRALDAVGSDLDNFACLRCGSTDRERHLQLYFERERIFDAIRGGAVLHFAPESKLQHAIRRAEPAEYIKADLYPQQPDVRRVDLCAMPFPDATFDLVIANHVLEHVDDDARALAEIFRVLRPGGTAILQTPYCAGLSRTIEDPQVTSPEARHELFGQEDHVRMYGTDLFARIVAAGFVDARRTHAEALPEIDPARYGVNGNEPLLRFRRPA